MSRKIQRSQEFEMVNRILEHAPAIDPFNRTSLEEFQEDDLG